MRLLRQTILVVVAIGLLWYTATVVFGGSSICKKGLEYAIGDVDERFGITETELKDLLTRVEAVWEGPFAKDLLIYDADADFKINFVFDERQQKTNRAKELESSMSHIDRSISYTTAEYDSLAAQYEAERTSYEAEAAMYESLQKELNQDIAYWNTHGGAPEPEYSNLVRRETELESMYNELNAMQSRLEDLRIRVNSFADHANALTTEYNSEVETFNNLYGDARQFDQGVYDGEQINIYEFEDLRSLKLVLAHELGHALGVDHTEDPRSIMHYLMDQQDLNNIALTEADIAALQGVCN